MANESAVSRARSVAEFVSDIIADGEWWMRIAHEDEVRRPYPREQIALLKACREVLEVMIEWREHPRRKSALEAGIDAIATLRRGAKSDGDNVSIVISRDVVDRLRQCMPHLVEYEVVAEKDSQRRPRRRA